MKEVCLISRKFDKKSGRAEWIYADILKEELEKRKIKVYTIEQKNANEKSPLIRKLIHDFLVIPIKATILRLKGVKIFHFLNENQAIFSWYVNLIGGKTITTYHDFLLMQRSYFFSKFLYKLASFSDEIICNSTKTREELKRLVNPKLNPHIIPPIIVDSFELKKNNRKLNKIGYLGGFDKRKRPSKLIDVMMNLPSNFKLFVWGKGELLDNLKETVLKKNLKNIYFKGYAPYEKIHKIYNFFNFFIFPTKHEGFGLPIIEAATYGNVIFILKDAKIPKEVKSFCIVCNSAKEIAEKILEISTKKDMYLRISNKNKIMSKKFSKKENLEKLIKIYKNLER